MNTKPGRETNTSIKELHRSLETLRSELVEVEAFANAAKEALDGVPYQHELDDDDGPRYRSAEERDALPRGLSIGRVITLVEKTAKGAKEALVACDDLVYRAYKVSLEPGGGRGGSGPGNGGSGGEYGHGPAGGLAGRGGGGGDDDPGAGISAPHTRRGIALDVWPGSEQPTSN